VVKALNRNLRSLCESCAVYALLCGQKQSNIQPRDFIDFSQVALDLPFLKDNNTAFALLFHSLLQSDDGEEKFTFEDRLAKVEAQFSPWILDVRTEIDRGLAFWSDCCAMMRDLCSMKRPEAATLPAHIRTIGIQFVEADNWLRAIIGAN
jgi:hypothetical protein